MLSRYAQNVASFFVRHGFIQKDDEEIYAYGYELLISGIINWTICIIIAIATHTIMETLFYTIVFIHFRETLGGFHAKSHWGCIVLSTVVYVLCLFIILMTPPMLHYALSIIGILIHLILVYFIAPVAHPNKPFSSLREIQIFRKRSCRLSLIYSLICIVLMVLPWEFCKLLSYCIMLGMLTASISMMVEFVIQITKNGKEGKK